MTRNPYQLALDVQTACNLSGVVHSLAEALPIIRDEVRASGGGTDEINRHPVVVLFVDKLADLAGVPHLESSIGEGHYSQAHFACVDELERLESI